MRFVIINLLCLSLLGMGLLASSETDTHVDTTSYTHEHPHHPQIKKESIPPWKKHLEAFELLIDVEDIESDAAPTELAKVAEHLFGAHPLVDEWKTLYLRLSRDKKGSIYDMRRVAEIVVQILTDIDPKKYQEQIQRYQKRVKYYDALAKEHKSQGDSPEAIEIEATRFQLREVWMDDVEELEKHLNTVNALLPTDPEAARAEFAKFAAVQFGNHPLVDEWSDIVFKMHRNKKGRYPDFVRMCELQIQMYKGVNSKKYAEHISLYQTALEGLYNQKNEIPDPENFVIKFTMTLRQEG